MINKDELLKLVNERINTEETEMLFARIEGASSVFATTMKINAMEKIKGIIVKMKEV